MGRLLVVDDEASIRHTFVRLFDGETLRVTAVGTAGEGIREFRSTRPDAVVLDVRLPDQSGTELFAELREIDPDVPVIVITGHGSTEEAIRAVQAGAFDYIFKPLELDQLESVVRNALEAGVSARETALRKRSSETQSVSNAPGVADSAGRADAGSSAELILVGRSRPMQDVYRDIGRVAARDVTVLILGESGTGKELVARAILKHSHRRDRPFVAVNCAAIPETLIESELFGHERGAFTGADQPRVGRLEEADGGTLFLDEVGDLSPATQSKLLRFLQERQFERVGSNRARVSDVRVIAATNRDLQKLVDEERFRQDLLYRLSVYTIRLPPLRERAGDVDALADAFVQRFRRQFRSPVREIAESTRALLRRYPWPGNVRELESVIKHGLLHAAGPVLLPQYLPAFVRDGEKVTAPTEFPNRAGS